MLLLLHGHPIPPGEVTERHLFDSGEDIKIPIPCPLRFPLGTLVEVHAGKAGWLTARVTRQFYRPHSADWPAGQHSAYECRLDRGGYMHSPCDVGPNEGIPAVPPSLQAYIERFVPRPSHDPDGDAGCA